SILTILGVIMYLRFAEVLGNTGLGQTLLIVVVAHLITVATGLSISAIATNRTVRAGGAYYIISRSLGAPAGAAIGVPLFLAQSLSITFYIVGFTESLVPVLPAAFLAVVPEWVVSSVVLWLLAFLTFKSADLAIKTQYVVMAAIGVSIIAFFTGTGAPQPEELTLWVEGLSPEKQDIARKMAADLNGLFTTRPAQPAEISWWISDGPGFGPMFALFFPAVTGIMAGVGMSGDLKDPRRSLPLGTMLAIGAGFLVYMTFPIWLAINAEPATLIERTTTIVSEISSVPALIFLGVWGATLSSALGSFLTAPRTLQALAFDGLAPKIFARGHGPMNEPRIGTIFTFILAQIGVLLGDLSAIAPILTMFFLATYGFTNLASGLEKWAANPSFRPTFKVPALISLAGGLGCFYVMSIIDLIAMIAAFVLCAAIYGYVQRRALEATWGDARHGIWAALVRTALYRLRRADFHPSNWRPNLLILGGGGKKRLHLLDLGSTIVQDRGIVTYMYLLQGSVAEHADQRLKIHQNLDEQISRRFPHVFSRVDIVDDLYRGVVMVAQSYGVGSFESNTVMIGWPKNADRHGPYLRMLRDLARLDRSILLVHYDDQRKFGSGRRIQIWWGGLQHNGGLMLLLAFLIIAHQRWSKAKVEIVTIVASEDERARAEEGIRKVVAQAHLDAEPRVLMRKGRSVRDVMELMSTGVDLAIVGMRLPDESEATSRFFDRMNDLLAVLPTTLLVHSARTFQSDPVLFDDVPTRPAGEESSAPLAAAQAPSGPNEAEDSAAGSRSGETPVSAAESMTGLVPELLLHDSHSDDLDPAEISGFVGRPSAGELVAAIATEPAGPTSFRLPEPSELARAAATAPSVAQGSGPVAAPTVAPGSGPSPVA
ncbi:MAG: hypothetical protein KC636_13550, partial [Myxococcales bacterium]|nr:hypothetical protein [Myxococcales bacterium]